MISNAKDRLLNQNSGTMPDVSGAILSWFQKMDFAIITKENINFQTVETSTDVSTQGVWQPLSPQQLMMKPEGQRQWKWFQVHALPGLNLRPDDRLVYLGTKYRVMAVLDYKLNGYMEYHVIDDYQAVTP